MPSVCRRVRQRQLKEPLVQLLDDLLFAGGIVDTAGAEAHVPVEALQAGGFLFQAALLQAFERALHRLGHRVMRGESVILEQRVEHRLGDEVLRQHPDGFILGDAVVQVVPDAGEEAVEERAHA